jgi:hypothetical protein
VAPRCCRFCKQSFQPSKYRPGQTVCGHPECQRRRRAEYHRSKLAGDPIYAQVVRDSQKKWRDAHPGYQKTYWTEHPAAADRNRQQQRQRDRKQRLGNLVKNNLVLDLKRSPTEAWLVGPAAGDLVKNNLAFSKLFIFQPYAFTAVAPAGS